MLRQHPALGRNAARKERNVVGTQYPARAQQPLAVGQKPAVLHLGAIQKDKVERAAQPRQDVRRVPLQKLHALRNAECGKIFFRGGNAPAVPFDGHNGRNAPEQQGDRRQSPARPDLQHAAGRDARAFFQQSGEYVVGRCGIALLRRLSPQSVEPTP